MEKMSQARIYRPNKTAMQSGKSQKSWILEFSPLQGKFQEPLMGWTGSTNTVSQVRLQFNTQKEAEAYAQAQGLEYVHLIAADRKVRKKSYSDNFRFDRVDDTF